VTDVAPLYDWLSRYVQLANWRAYGDRYAGLTMHKPLAVGGTSAVNDRVFATAGLARGARVLDAGCGFGGTIFAFHEQLGGQCDGLTLSRVQQRVAAREAARRGVDLDCRFHVRSFDDPIEARYDAIVAIETLVHSPDFAHSLANLAGALSPRGALLVVEDIPQASIDGTHDAELLARHWACPHLPTEDDYRQGFAREELTIEHEDDLTPLVRFRDATTVDALEERYTRWYRRVPLAPVRAVLAAYLGGLAIERLYARAELRYRLFVARRWEAVGR
jgi:2-polyprenyl-3-methyl-5-hydroxy-6-metoxy-1,4-benzoquinol methylase